MTNGYTRSPKLLKGALVEFSERFIGPVPNIILFQYNPESLTRSLNAWQPAGAERNPATQAQTPANAQPAPPPESFDLVLELDATDDLEAGDPLAVVSGVADRIAALEMLMYPASVGAPGDLRVADGVSVTTGAGNGGSASTRCTQVPVSRVPIVLFVWGPGRILPVRVTSFQVEEQMFSPTLYPLQAKVTVGLEVQNEADLDSYEDGLAKDLAREALKFTYKQRKLLAAANVANAGDSILGMLPF